MNAAAPVTLIRRWGEMVKFSHSVFALPFALMATFLAARAAYDAHHSPLITHPASLSTQHSALGTSSAVRPWPSWPQIALIIACMITARSVAMTFNRIVDARIDARNPRTAGRAIPAGTISRRQALAFLAVSSALFVIACGGFFLLDGNQVPLRLSIPVLLYLCFYSYTKRFTRWSHFVLGSAIAFAPVAAWLAIHPESVGWPAIVLMAAVTLWIAGFDIIYACQDIAFDRAAGLFSLPARLGPARALWMARVAHTGTVALLLALMRLADLGNIYLAGVVITTALLLYEHWLVRPNDFSRVNVAFFTVNGMISMVLAALTILDVLLRP